MMSEMTTNRTHEFNMGVFFSSGMRYRFTCPDAGHGKHGTRSNRGRR